MDMNGEYVIPAARQKVWEALNDITILKQCIPGCETIEQQSPTQMSATVRAKVGPVSARFGGKVTLSDLDPPNGYKISGEGTGGPAGFAKGGASVQLTDDPSGGTKLSYTVEANVGGKLAQIGSRLIDATARKMADEFFSKFAGIVGAEGIAASAAASAAPAAAAPTAAEPLAVAEMPPAPDATIAQPANAAVPKPATAQAAAPASGRLSPVVWVTILAAAVALLLYFFTRG